MERVKRGQTRIICVPERDETGAPQSALAASASAESAMAEACALCGAFRFFPVLERAARASRVAPKDLLVVSSLGCSLDWSGLWRPYGFRCASGGALPLALGAALANPDLTVLAFDDAASLCDAELLEKAARCERLVCCALEAGGAGAPALAAALAAGAGMGVRVDARDRAAVSAFLARALGARGLSWLQLAPSGSAPPRQGDLTVWADRPSALAAVGAWTGPGPFGAFTAPSNGAAPISPRVSPIKSRLELTLKEREALLESLL